MTGFDQDPDWRRTWCRHAGALFGQPLRMQLHRPRSCRGLQGPRRLHRRHVPGQSSACTANDSIEVHPFLVKPRDMTPLEFDIPREATRRRTLNLSWYADPGRGGNGRGCQVAEVWLIKKSSRQEAVP